MQDRYGDYFEGCMGAEAIKKRLQDFDLEAASKPVSYTHLDVYKRQEEAPANRHMAAVQALLGNDTEEPSER